MPEKDDDDDFGTRSNKLFNCCSFSALVDARACRNTFIVKTHRIC